MDFNGMSDTPAGFDLRDWTGPSLPEAPDRSYRLCKPTGAAKAAEKMSKRMAFETKVSLWDPSQRKREPDPWLRLFHSTLESALTDLEKELKFSAAYDKTSAALWLLSDEGQDCMDLFGYQSNTRDEIKKKAISVVSAQIKKDLYEPGPGNKRQILNPAKFNKKALS